MSDELQLQRAQTAKHITQAVRICGGEPARLGNCSYTTPLPRVHLVRSSPPALSNLPGIPAVRCGTVLTKPESGISGGRRQRRAMPAAEELAALTLPPLACSFPSMVHPDYPHVKAQCDEWIEMVAQPPSLREARRLKECLLPLLVCRFIPRAISRRRLVQAIKLIAWLMVADDDDDHPEVLGCDDAYTAQRANCIMAILAHRTNHGMSAEHQDGLSPRCLHRLTALKELWQEIRMEMSPFLQSRFVASMADYLQGLKAQAIMRKEGQVPDVNSYMYIRRQASFTIPCFIMVEYSSGITLDANLLKNPCIIELLINATDYISLWNDMVSCCKEMVVGDYFNMPSILYLDDMGASQQHISFQGAINLVSQLTNDVEDRCKFLMNSLQNEYSQSFILPLQALNVFNYVEVVALAMAGALTWFFETPRYVIATQKSISKQPY